MEQARPCIRQVMVERLVESPGYIALDITPLVQGAIVETDFVKGVAIVYSPEEMVCPVLIEYEPGLLADLEELIGRLGGPLAAEAVLGKTVFIPVYNGSMEQGVFKHVVLIDLSRRRGRKRVVVVLEGVFREDNH